MGRSVRRAERLAAPLVTFAVLCLLWQLVATHSVSILPPLGDVAAELVGKPGFYLANIWVTLSSAILGFAVGALAAIAMAIGFVHLRWLRDAVFPIALLINVTPIVAISPALIVVFGFDATPHVIVAALSAFFPMLINAMTGFRDVDLQALDIFRSMAATPADIFFRLRLPGSLPQLFAGARLASVAAVIGSIVSEFTGTSEGIGATIVIATTYLDLAQMWAAIFCSALVTMLLIRLLELSERLIVRW